jgi:adenine-specific DNA glycosylase
MSSSGLEVHERADDEGVELAGDVALEASRPGPSPAALSRPEVDDVTEVIRPLGLISRGRQLVALGQELAGLDTFPGTVDEELWNLVHRVLPADPPMVRRLNWAVLDLAATVCSAAWPRCTACPLSTSCSWLAAESHTVAGTGSPG